MRRTQNRRAFSHDYFPSRTLPLRPHAAFGRVDSDILSKESWQTADYINAQNGIKFCPLGIWSIYNYTEKISMAPALRMVSSNPSFGEYFPLFKTLY